MMNLALNSPLAIAMYVIFGLIFLGSLTMLGLSLADFVKKEEDVTTLFKGKHRLIALSVLVGALSFMLLFLPFALTTTNTLYAVMIMSGSVLTMAAFLLFVTSFILHYYKFNVVKVATYKSKLITYLSLVFSLLFLFLLLDGLTFAELIKFPLPSGIPLNNPFIAFYAIFILGGAILVYFISDHEFYKKYGRHGILENVFYVAFPAGIIGSRIWYVIGEWESGGFAADWTQIFAIRDGGLAIMGGALFGIIAGVWFFVARRKEYSIFFAADIIVPTILVAQAVGRWGNFFNQEVYGGVITNIEAWWFVPEFVKRNMFIAGEYRQPFFLIESLLNLTGYFVIRYAVGEGLKKYKKPLDLAFLYLVWYGLVRFIMEPLRDPSFRMGTRGEWSKYNALILLIIGVLLIIINHIVDFEKQYLKLKNKKAPVVNEEDTHKEEDENSDE
ncbi:MAG: prolipoprotein diacylglyceryl transferase [Bacilli bacterium]